MTTINTTAVLTTTKVSDKVVLVTITVEENVTEFSVKNGPCVITAIDRKLDDLMWNRSGFNVDMTATLTRPALFLMLQKINARG